MTLGPSRPQSNVKWLLAEYARTGHLPAISGGSGEDEHSDGKNGTEDGGGADGKNGAEGKPKVTFTDEQQAEINRIVAREAKAARDKAITAEQARIKAEQDAAEAERKRQADEAKGDFEKVKQSLTTDLETVKGERDALKVEHEALTAYFQGVYDAALKELPEDYLDFKPADDAPFAEKSAWLTKAQARAKERQKETSGGNRPNPPSNGRAIDTAMEQRARLALRPRL